MIERYELKPGYEISRVIKGGWQLAEGHSSGISQEPVADMLAFVQKGINTFDCADIYTGVEELIGQFVADCRGRGASSGIKVHTKYVPDYNKLGSLTRANVEKVIDRSLLRLKMDRLDMVQFHWWNYQVPGWLETSGWLQELQQAGKIDLLSTTNFNTDKTEEMIKEGLVPATVQVQYSLLDPRPEKALISLCSQHGVHLLCYGTLAGGFLSKRWLGVEEPENLENRSLIKYKLMIDEVGGWELFQELLKALHAVARRHGTSIASVASRWILDQNAVAAAIIGARNARHIDRYEEIFHLTLDQQDLELIQSIKQQMKVPPGDVFDLERDKEGKHGRIMKYNLNAS